MNEVWFMLILLKSSHILYKLTIVMNYIFILASSAVVLNRGSVSPYALCNMKSFIN